MTLALIRPRQIYAWKGPSLFIVDERGDCGDHAPLTGFYYREARFLSRLRLELNGVAPWLCESSALEPAILAFTYVHPELTSFGGGGSGQSGDEETKDEAGIPHRALVARVRYALVVDGLNVSLTVTNGSRSRVDCEVRWALDADFADIQEAHDGTRQQHGTVDRETCPRELVLTYGHPELPYRSAIHVVGAADWSVATGAATVRIQLDAQQSIELGLRVRPSDPGHGSTDEAQPRERHLASWCERLTRIASPGNRLAEKIVASNTRDLASFPWLDGEPGEWLALQAGVPLYPAVFGRDSITTGWQAACLDRGESLDATLTLLGRLQSDRVYDWRDEEPGRIPYQIRQGPLARLDINPYAAYYADYASPLMFIVGLAHLYAWTGETRSLRRHWDAARRILDWARTYGDKDGDGYLEYETRSSKGTKNQGWKDSGDAIVYEDGRPVPAPLGTCELQGYWFAAQQAMAVMSWVMGSRDDASAYWRSAADLKARFNRDWWVDGERFIALAMDSDKRLVTAVTSNVGHCLACGIIDDAHLPPVVGRLFAPDMFSGWGVRTLSTDHVAYNALSYHRGTVWAVEQATIAFGLRRFGFDVRALDIAKGLFDLAQLYPEYRIPECVGGLSRGQDVVPGAYPRANTPQLWNAGAFPLLIHTIAGLQPVAALDLLVIDPVLPSWLPELVLEDLRVAGATATLRFWRDGAGRSHGEIVRKRGTLRLVKQPPPESLSAGLSDRFAALADSVFHSAARAFR